MVCFLDTNVFLECNSISEIDWSLITEDTEITIYICFTVLDELDKFKTDQNNRRRRKAVNSIKLLSQIFEQHIAIAHKQQCFHLSVKMADNYANEELKALKGLDISRNDDLIIATVALFNERTNNNAILISHDLGIRLKGNHFFTCRDVPAKWLLVEEKNEIQKENERLKAELLQFQKKEPLIECNLFINNTLLENNMKDCINLTLYEKLSNEQVDDYMRRIEFHCPKVLNDSISSSEKEMQVLAGFRYVESLQKKIEKYNREYIEWLKHQKNVLENFSKKHNEVLLIYPIRIELENSGIVPAESFEIELFSNAGIFFKTNDLESYKEEVIEYFYVPPEAPKEKFETHPWLNWDESDFDNHLISPILLRNPCKEYPYEEIKDKFEFYSFYEDGKLKIQCEEMQHQKGKFTTESFFLIDEDSIKNNKVNLSYQIYAKNLSKPKIVTHTIKLNVKRVSAIDLIEKELKEIDCI